MEYENLYNSLSYNLPDADLSNTEKQDLLDIIQRLTSEKKETVYLLILHDYTKYNPNTKVIFPYKSKQISANQLEIKVDALPTRLKRILLKFCKLADLPDIPDE